MHFPGSTYRHIGADGSAVSTLTALWESAISVRPRHLSAPHPGLESDGDHRNDDHDDHAHQAHNHTNDEGHHLIVLRILLFKFCLSNLFDGFIESLHQEVERVTPAVLVFTPHIHLVCCPRLELSHLKLGPGALHGLHMSACHVVCLQNEQIPRVAWQCVTRNLKYNFLVDWTELCCSSVHKKGCLLSNWLKFLFVDTLHCRINSQVCFIFVAILHICIHKQIAFCNNNKHLFKQMEPCK